MRPLFSLALLLMQKKNLLRIFLKEIVRIFWFSLVLDLLSGLPFEVFFGSQKLFSFSEFLLSEFLRHVLVDFQGFVKILPVACRTKKLMHSDLHNVFRYWSGAQVRMFSAYSWFCLLLVPFSSNVFFSQCRLRYPGRCKLVGFYCESIIFNNAFQIVGIS